MALSEVSKDNPEVMCRLDELAKHADLTPDQARYAFIWLLENVFASGNWHQLGDNANINIITVKGADEAERLRTPFWKQIATERTVQIGIIVSVITSAIGFVFGLILKMVS